MKKFNENAIASLVQRKMENARSAIDSAGFFQRSASKYKNAGSYVRRDDSSFRQRFHYSGGFARNADSEKWSDRREELSGEWYAKGWLPDGLRVLEVPQWTVMGQVEGSLAIPET